MQLGDCTLTDTECVLQDAAAFESLGLRLALGADEVVVNREDGERREHERAADALEDRDGAWIERRHRAVRECGQGLGPDKIVKVGSG